MPWLDDVVPQTTIRSVWGNSIRDRVVMTYANKGERDAQPSPKEGMVCHVADIDIVYLRHANTWQVLEMPWRPFTPRAYQADVNGNGRIQLGLSSTQVAQWKQTLGRCSVLGQFVAVIPATTSPYDLTIYLWAPVTAQAGGPAGYARLVPASTAVAHGGGANFNFHDAPGSGFLVVNVGPGVSANATIRNSTNSINLFCDENLTYACDPTVDTP